MKTVKSEKISLLFDIFEKVCEKNALKKVILSKPYASDEIKSVITEKNISGKNVLQTETFLKDNKACHTNTELKDIKEIFTAFTLYDQINLISSVGECQFMRSKSGKETVIGGEAILKKLSNGDFKPADIKENNRQKNYILSGNEDFLKKLSISDESGRVRDKMQSKFRQINRFIEHIKAIEDKLPKDKIVIYDLCCGKSYLSFAVYHYFKNILGLEIDMICIDLKKDVIEYCSNLAKRLMFDNMTFVCEDINEYKMLKKPDMVISLHACDTATDVVLNKASENGAKAILSTPCCHHELNKTINCRALSFITKYSMLRQKLCDALTDSLRLLKLESEGYSVDALELIDPEDTPKNIMLRAIKKENFDIKNAEMLRKKYTETLNFLLGKGE